jgi:hypothetical protein
MERIRGCAQGQMSQGGCGNSFEATEPFGRRDLLRAELPAIDLVVLPASQALFQSATVEYQDGVRSIFRSTIIFSNAAR